MIICQVKSQEELANVGEYSQSITHIKYVYTDTLIKVSLW